VTGKSAGTVELSGAVFNRAWNADLVHQVVIGMQANARTGLAHTNSEVKFLEVVKNLGNKREQVAHDTGHHDHQFG
jgi:hypothetical protein